MNELFYEKYRKYKKKYLNYRNQLSIKNLRNLKYNTKTYLQNVKNNNDIQYIFITGRGSMGKTHLADELGKLGFTVVHIDDIVEEIAKKHPDGIKIFALYHPGKYPKEKQEVIKIVQNVIKKNDKVVIEGLIRDKNMINQFFMGMKFQFVYVRPKSIEIYKKYLIKRFEYEIKNNLKNLSWLWDYINGEILDDYNKFGTKSKKFIQFIEERAKEAFKRLPYHYKLYEDFDFILVFT